MWGKLTREIADIDFLKGVTNAEDIDADAMRTDKGFVGNASGSDYTPYNLVSNEDQIEINVPGDFPTIQDAIDAQAHFNRHDTLILVDDGYDEDEDLIFRNYHQGGFTVSGRAQGTAGENAGIEIVGNQTDPSQVKVRSLTAVGCVGVCTPQIWGVEFKGEKTPYADESACVTFHGCDEGFLGDCAFVAGSSDPASEAVQFYGSGGHVRTTDFGTDNFTHGIVGKRNARIYSRHLTGSVTDDAYRCTEYTEQYIEDGGLSGDRHLGQGGRIIRNDKLDYQHYSDRRGAHVTRDASNQSVGSGAWTTVEFDTTERDHLSMWDGANYQLSIPEHGAYKFESSIAYLSVSSGTEIQVRLRDVTNATTVAQVTQTPGAAGTQSLPVSASVDPQPDTLFEVQAKHNEGAALDLNGFGGMTYCMLDKM